jgi:hypothetical protein
MTSGSSRLVDTNSDTNIQSGKLGLFADVTNHLRTNFIVSRDVSFTPESGHVRRSSLYSLWADSGPYNQLLSAFDGRHCHIRINDINRIPRRKCNDLVEDIAKLRLKFLSCDITNVWRRNDLF